MVSLRRRKLLGLCSGKSPFFNPLPRFFDNGNGPESSSQNAKSVIVHPMPSDSVNHMYGKSIAKIGSGSPNISGSGSSKEHHNQHFPGQPIKRRKRHRRKHVQNQEPCLMRGVYFKNMKWQAAIKVDKKQIHLGTVGSQEEAARLYDRAAFMCGREPNFELPEEEKLELRKFKWDEFLAYTRRSITDKKYKRRVEAGQPKRFEPAIENGDWDSKQGAYSFSASEEVGLDSSA
ncbi:ethylene-responsive transcription factor-like protein At4g13040 [Durio zibethinus]|uniref:Ethylene-responsive transcription factor-like protein At4g13040 n=1 Tax=Durio zibethinus TaxID=66656 RepID=A0A6P5XJA1_DURZI|nr:ethylene-responsive transcription factor-like protein At4g13040 [Durio zibethinus]XP_022728264.1 ethylene-responsive transcription factor-like protein At4g13040 [Durio zibethinus]XP_022728265.1 ethylene-responsive transcription factor-like protein At4g13040 [Durio zibethinus]XP_022728266.1 ethylene-responsive transcription factor-like protein At4g13040 [Durio zibethinus]XP_022728267.1 ethylene-responsive transcription factor-like protein At4g13040 [Durio zibethinus]XP_022728268.1 ethylene-r